jgi:hypothetical protein
LTVSPSGLIEGAVLYLPNDPESFRGQRGTQSFAFAESGLTIEKSGTLNGSSPTANLAGVNIKGNEASLHFPLTWFAAVFLERRCWNAIAVVISAARGEL